MWIAVSELRVRATSEKVVASGSLLSCRFQVVASDTFSGGNSCLTMCGGTEKEFQNMGSRDEISKRFVSTRTTF